MLNKNVNPSRIMKCYLIIAIIALTGVAAKAQNRFNTNESIASQIKNGTAPGLLFSEPAPAKKESVTDPVNKESLGKQIRSNTMPGLLYKTTTAKSQTDLNIQAKPEVPLVNDKATDNQSRLKSSSPKTDQ